VSAGARQGKYFISLPSSRKGVDPMNNNSPNFSLSNHQHSQLSIPKIYHAMEPYLFVAPMVLMILAFNLYTFFTGGKMSLTDAQGIDPGVWIGLANFKELIFEDPDFWPSLYRSFSYTIGCLLTQIPVALILAVILNNITERFRGILRASFYVPVLINTVVAALMFRMFFIRDTGVANWLLGILKLPNDINWLYDSNLCIPLMVIVSFWQWTGYHMVYLLASMQSIDPAIYEVAKLDGASPIRTLLQITLPLLRPALTFVIITATIGGIQLFDLPFMLFPNGGYGPGQQAMTAIPFIYYNGFSNNFRLGYSAAAGWIVFLIIFVISLFQLKFLGFGKADEK
jgi:ABC-type sugar transport system permease subunit